MLVSLCPSVFLLFLFTAVHNGELLSNTVLSGYRVPGQEKEMGRLFVLGCGLCRWRGETSPLHRHRKQRGRARHPFQKESFSGSLRPSYTRAEFTAFIFPLYRQLFVTRAAPCLYPAAVAARFQNKSTKNKKQPQKSQCDWLCKSSSYIIFLHTELLHLDLLAQQLCFKQFWCKSTSLTCISVSAFSVIWGFNLVDNSRHDISWKRDPLPW